jgi:hypothetical protein
VLLVLGRLGFIVLGAADGAPGARRWRLLAQALALLLLDATQRAGRAGRDEALSAVPAWSRGGAAAAGCAGSSSRWPSVPDVERVVDVAYSQLHPRHRLDVYRRKDTPPAVPRCSRCMAEAG